ncbi:MAG TPA: hypothetical protein VEA69_25785, partial [Tepidisphaeraceae bacterium]|nr:hypothetical protein [Tepidisphaeraceae bacterium]
MPKSQHKTCSLRIASIAVFLTPLLARAETLTLDAPTLLARSASHNVHLLDNAIQLLRHDLIEDDGPAAGFSYKPNEDKLGPSVQFKKDLVIADPRAAGATLLIACTDDVRPAVNGTPITAAPAKLGHHWLAFPVDPALLKPGKNEIVLSGAGKVWIARDDEFAAGSTNRTKHPNRSARSTDAGITWDYDRLGPKGDIDGEYNVRLALDRHQPAGSITLPVLDAANLARHPIPPTVATPVPIHFAIDAHHDASGTITLKARTGPTPTPDDKWTPWASLDTRSARQPPSKPGAEPKGDAPDSAVGKRTTAYTLTPAARYLELAIDLSTTDPLHSPKLRSISIDSATSPAPSKHLRLIAQHNTPLARSAIPFAYEPFDHPTLAKLRKDHNLDQFAQSAASEFELITRLAKWSANLWTKGHLGQIYPKWDALDILRPHADGKPVGGFCLQYNIALLQACESFGIPGRMVSLGPTADDKPRRSGHEVIELWSNDFAKWVYVDGQLAWYAADAATGVPLSLLELRDRQLAALAGKPYPPIRPVPLDDKPRDDWHKLDTGVPFVELRLIPRSNFLAEPAPLPLNQGMRGWFWTGHHLWADTQHAPNPIYPHRVTTRASWEPTLNQAHITLEPTDNPNQFRVHLTSQTPGLQTYTASIDNAPAAPVVTGFTWSLNPGKNTL